MAKNVKNKKKKRSNYDDKLIMIIAASVGAALAVIVAAICIISYTGSYVAKVDGERIMKFEYEYFLTNTMQEMKDDAIEEGTLKEDADAAAIAKFWTDAKKKEAADKALDEAKKWKAQYILADDKGFSLGYKERNEYKQNIEYQIYSSYSQYSQYYSYDEYVKAYLGMDLKDYQTIAIQSAAISAYKEDMKKAYSATDEELKNIYNENPDDFRKITLSVLALQKPTKPAEVTKPSDTKEDGTKKAENNMSAADWAAYQDDVKAYEKYEEEKAEYDAELKKLEERRDKILAALKADGKYTEEKEKTSETNDEANKDATTESTDKKTDADSNYVYKDATLADIASKEGALFAEDKGKVVINALSECGQDVLDELALQMQWKDEKRDTIVCIKDKTEDTAYNGGETVDGITYTQYVGIGDDNYLYIVRCTGIEDFDNSKESSAGAEDSVKDTVRRDLYEDKATEALDKMVENAGKKFAVKSKKQAEINKIAKAVSWN
ncbi:MAG: hypothetical protein E7384_01690 [Ruminococcaceae bacterium]|nr:hypothetical protein [Oscillospiraceae bacterium]